MTSKSLKRAGLVLAPVLCLVAIVAPKYALTASKEKEAFVVSGKPTESFWAPGYKFPGRENGVYNHGEGAEFLMKSTLSGGFVFKKGGKYRLTFWLGGKSTSAEKPIAVLALDAKPLRDSVNVAVGEPTPYDVDAEIKAGRHELSISYPNPAPGGQLYLKGVSITPR